MSNRFKWPSATLLCLLNKESINLKNHVDNPMGNSIYYLVFVMSYGAQVYAVLAQQVERIHGKDEVTGSNPVNGLIR